MTTITEQNSWLRQATALTYILALNAATALATPAAEITYSDFLARVETHSPENDIENTLSERAQQTCSRKGYLPDPVLSGGVDGNTPKVAVSQEFPWPGTLGSQAEAACAETQLTKVDLTEAALLRADASARLFLNAVARSENLATEQKTLTEIARLQEYVSAKTKAGLATHAERIGVELERVQLGVAIKAQENELAAIQKQMRLVAGLEPSSNANFVLKWPEANTVPTKPDMPSPDLLAQRLSLENELAKAQLNAEQLGTRPSLNTQITAMRDSMGEWMPGFMVGFRLPLFSSLTRAPLLRQEKLNAALNNQNQNWNQQKKSLALEVASARVEQARDNLKLLNEHAIPMAEEHLKLVFSDFSASKASTQDVVQAHRDALRLQTEKTRATLALREEELNLKLLNMGIGNTDPMSIRDFPTISLPSAASSMSSSLPSMQGSSAAQKRTTPKAKGTRPGQSDSSNTVTQPAPSGGMNM